MELRRWCVTSALGVLIGVSLLSQHGAEAVGDARQTPTTLPAVLRCAHDALGGEAVLNGVKALRWTGETAPAPGVSGPIPSEIEAAFVLPNQYRRLSQPSTGSLPGGVVGVDGSTVLSGLIGWPAPDTDAARELATARQSFARDVLMLLVRTLPTVNPTLSFRGLQPDQGIERLVIHASGSDGFNATLFLDARTCQPAALTYERPANFGDMRRENQGPVQSGGNVMMMTPPAPGETRVERIDLADYRPFGGIRFPTTLTRSIGGRAQTVERVSDLQVNPSLPPSYFRKAQ